MDQSKVNLRKGMNWCLHIKCLWCNFTSKVHLSCLHTSSQENIFETCVGKCRPAVKNVYLPRKMRTIPKSEKRPIFFYEINVLVYRQNMKIELDNDRINMWSLFIRINFRLFLFSPKRSHGLWYRCYREANQGPFISVNMRLFMVRRSNVNHPFCSGL